MFYKSDGEITDKVKIFEFYNDLLHIKEKIKLDRTLFRYYDRCFAVNDVLAKHGFFLKFFERRDMLRFLVHKKVTRKNEITRKLLGLVTEKFDGYETIKDNLARKEKMDFTPLDIVHELTYDENIPVTCYFTGQIHRAYRSYMDRSEKGQEKCLHRSVNNVTTVKTVLLRPATL